MRQTKGRGYGRYPDRSDRTIRRPEKIVTAREAARLIRTGTRSRSADSGVSASPWRSSTNSRTFIIEGHRAGDVWKTSGPDVVVWASPRATLRRARTRPDRRAGARKTRDRRAFEFCTGHLATHRRKSGRRLQYSSRSVVCTCIAISPRENPAICRASDWEPSRTRDSAEAN